MRNRLDQNASGPGVIGRWICVALASVLFGSAGLAVPLVSQAAAAPRCQGADVDLELCLVSGVRDGTFLLQDRDATVVASIPSDPGACPDQSFEVTLEYPKTKPDRSVPRELRTAPVLTVQASASSCSRPAPSRVLRLERSESRYGLAPQDLEEGAYTPSATSISSIGLLTSNPALDVGLRFVRPAARVDSLARFAGPSLIVAGKPCGTARRRSACNAKYAKALAGTPTPYGRSNCGRCPAPPEPLALLYTRRDEVQFVTDLKAFLGPIDTAADAALLRDSSEVAALDGGAWLVMRNEIDGTCDPFERAEVYERVESDGRIERVVRLLVSRQFGACA
jgi:hypothetical protein